MPITLDKPYLGLRIAGLSNVPVFAPREGFCDGIVLDTPYIGLRVATLDGEPVFVVGDQKLNADGTAILDKPYIGLRASQIDGTLVYLVDGKVCENSNPMICDCEICCTLDAVVQVGNGVAGDPWTAPLDVVLTCNGSLQINCSGDATSLLITKTYSGKDTIGSPEAYSGGGASGTREVLSDVWNSEDFVIDSETYRLSYWRAGGTVYQTSPSVVTTEICEAGWFLQHLANDVDYGDYWEVVAGTDFADWIDTNDFEWLFNVALNGPEACTSDLTIFAGCDKYTGTYTSVVETAGDAESCPVFLWHSSRYRLTADPDICDNYIKCANVMIVDRCSPRLSCDLETVLSAGITQTLDWEVTGCHSSSGSHEKTGAACSEFWMFNAGTAGLGWEGAGTEFDGDAPSGAGSQFADFCDSEEVVWIDTGTRYGRIEAALVCYTPEIGDPYIAAYARLEYNCYEILPPLTGCGGSYYGYKTRDLAITLVDDEIVVSFTGLTPFSSYTPVADPCPCSTCVCECDPAPTLSLAWRIKISECE